MFFVMFYIAVPYMYVLCVLHFMRNKRWWW